MTFSLMDRGPLPAGRSDSSPEQFTKESILRDYRIAFESREASLVGEKQVFTGKAKFGIFGAGKEVPQVALARAFRAGDFRSGYYRDQTLMFALGLIDSPAVLRAALRTHRPRARSVRRPAGR